MNVSVATLSEDSSIYHCHLKVITILLKVYKKLDMQAVKKSANYVVHLWWSKWQIQPEEEMFRFNDRVHMTLVVGVQIQKKE